MSNIPILMCGLDLDVLMLMLRIKKYLVEERSSAQELDILIYFYSFKCKEYTESSRFKSGGEVVLS